MKLEDGEISLNNQDYADNNLKTFQKIKKSPK
jgi:hypothetical protein